MQEGENHSDSNKEVAEDLASDEQHVLTSGEVTGLS